MQVMSELRIGTSGWHYGHWAGRFYPPEVKVRDYLRYYARHFDAVEINNTHYRLPKHETFAAWRDEAPAGFVFAVKASRYITHYSKLTKSSKTYGLFFDAVAILGDKLGPILFQTPPGWRVNAERLDTFLSELRPGLRTAFEFRNDTWFCDEVYQVLSRHNAAFCIWHLAGVQAPLAVTGRLVYVRLHGPQGAYGGSYSDEDLAAWADRIARWRAEGHDVHVYFDNDANAYAVHNALRLAEILGHDRRGDQ